MLHYPVRKKERANTKSVAIKKARALAARKAPAKKKASRYARTSSATGRLCVIREDALDVRMIREDRGADKGKQCFTVNELRAQRSLAPI
jgi:hypothetical protein